MALPFRPSAVGQTGRFLEQRRGFSLGHKAVANVIISYRHEHSVLLSLYTERRKIRA
jgi:hypothetical protein